MTITLNQTQIVAQFVINTDDRQVMDFLAALTVLIGLLVQFSQFIAKAVVLMADIAEGIYILLTLYLIIFKVGLFVLGVKI